MFKKQADVNNQDEEYDNELQAASAKGHKAAMQLLLDQGADVYAQSEIRGNALYMASFEGHETVVQLLLKNGADINAQGGSYDNALQAASSKGHETIVQLLLKNGADVNAQGGYYGNALQAASSKGHETIVKLLIDFGADVNAQGGYYRNALQAALSEGYERVEQLLVKSGADFEAQGGYHNNALQAASYKGHEKVVPQLLQTFEQCEMCVIVRKAFLEGRNASHATGNLKNKARIVYHCFWELPNTIRTQFVSGQRLSQVMTLTGTTENAQAATCEDFISQFWPSSGSLLLKAIEEFLTSVESNSKKGKPETLSRLSEDSTSIEIRSVIKSGKGPATEGLSETRITVDTSLGKQHDMAETLAWLAATIRTSKGVALAESKVQLVFQDPLSSEADASYRLTLEPLEVSNSGPPMCWHPLFVNAILAVQFAIFKRTQGYGIELSPFLMARLAGIIMPVEFLGGYILKGLSTALIPMEELEVDGAIQWHLLVTELTDDVIEVKEDFFRVKDVKTLMNRKAYLGWCKVAKVLLGTHESNTADVGWSDPSTKQQKIKLSGFSLGVASSGMGIFGPSASANLTLPSNCRSRFVDTKQTLHDRLNLSVVRPVLLYDTSEKRAWLVPTVCILLHMMHLRCRELSKLRKSSTEEDLTNMPRAEIGGYSAREAYIVLTQFLEGDAVTSLGSSEIWTETLARFYICLDMALNESMKIEETLSSELTNILGFELMDIVLSESPFRFTERKIRKQSGGWTQLARHVGYALFCSGLGNAIMPGTGGNELCLNWSSLPSDFDYLAAYIPCLIDVLQRQGLHKGIQRLRNTTSEPMLYKDCHHLESSRCQHLQLYESIVNAPQNDQERNSGGATSSHTQRALPTEDIGAIIFGKITKLQKPYPKNLQQVSDRQSDIIGRNCSHNV